MGFQANPFGHDAYKYTPSSDIHIERHPDRRRSSSRIDMVHHDTGLLWIMEVRGLGAIVMRAESTSSRSGKVKFNAAAIFTDEEIKFDS